MHEFIETKTMINLLKLKQFSILRRLFNLHLRQENFSQFSLMENGPICWNYLYLGKPTINNMFHYLELYLL